MVCSVFPIPQIVDFFHLSMEIYFGVRLQKIIEVTNTDIGIGLKDLQSCTIIWS